MREIYSKDSEELILRSERTRARSEGEYWAVPGLGGHCRPNKLLLRFYDYIDGREASAR